MSDEKMEVRVGPYILKQKIASGAFGQVFLGIDADLDTEPVIIKLEKVSAKRRNCTLRWEKRLYTNMWTSFQLAKEKLGKYAFEEPIPRVHAFMRTQKYRALVMEKMHASLSDHLKVQTNNHFSLKTVLMLGQVLINHLHSIHRCGVVHRDIKPDNIVVDKTGRRVLFIDFGLSYYYINLKTNKHIPRVKTRAFMGTERYASINCYRRVNLSRRDDLISLFYVLIYLYKGWLPWQGFKEEDDERRRRLIYRTMKKKGDPRILCGEMPRCFSQNLRDILSLRFNETPNYETYISRFSDEMKNLGMIRDFQYDWCV